jgi:hypothetical protein
MKGYSSDRKPLVRINKEVRTLVKVNVPIWLTPNEFDNIIAPILLYIS